jgi:Na+-driven multidrug efflux pump
MKRMLLATPIGIVGAGTAMPLIAFPVGIVFGICLGTALFCAVYFGLEGYGKKRNV